MNRIKNFVRKFIPGWILSVYHYLLAQAAGLFFAWPAKKIVVIGITGTKGKTSTANFIWSVLNFGGLKTGLIGTANIHDGNKEFLNPYHMTMPGPFVMQKILKTMLNNNCSHAVIEVTSEGLKLWRHLGINFDVAVFTNLTPEHLPSHGGSFEKYKSVKGQLFQTLTGRKIIIVNADSLYAEYFLQFPAKEKITYSVENKSNNQAQNILTSDQGADFNVGSERFHLSTVGNFNVYNALPAVIIGQLLNIPMEKIRQGLANLKTIPGRMELIDLGQNFRVLVDYAHEKVSMNAVLDTAKNLAEKNKVIVLLGAEGGGRDKSKRAAMGEAAAKKANHVVVSNVDPYDDDPKEILEDIAKACEQFGKSRNQNLFVIEDRREGIAKALSLAKEGDVVVITGKGAEQSMIISNKKIPWDDREVVREELQKLLKK